MRRPYRGENLPEDAAGHDALVVLGGGQNALDDEDMPYIPSLLSLMRDFGDSGRSVLGICLGSQLLARAYGAENLLGAAPEFGWQSVSRTRRRRSRSGAWRGAGTRSDLPMARRHLHLAMRRGASCHQSDRRNQAFRIGRAAYGIQFHFEADRRLVGHWTKVFADYLAEHHPGWAGRHEEEAATHGPQADAAGLALARAWVGDDPAGRGGSEGGCLI